MYICKYVYMYICIHVYMYKCIYVYVCICIYVYMCIYLYMYIVISTHAAPINHKPIVHRTYRYHPLSTCPTTARSEHCRPLAQEEPLGLRGGWDFRVLKPSHIVAGPRALRGRGRPGVTTDRCSGG